MDDVPIFLIAATIASLVFVWPLMALGRRYSFSNGLLTIHAFGWLAVRRLAYDQVTLEAVGKPSDEVSRLRERLPDRKVIDLTRSVFSRWTVCGFVSTPDAIHILPHAVARAVVSRNPPVRWRIMQAERRQRLEELPEKVLEKWPATLRIGTATAASLFTLIAVLHLAYAASVIWHWFQQNGLWMEALAELCLYHLCAPLLAIGCGVWLSIGALLGKTPSRFIRLLAVAASVSGLVLARMSDISGANSINVADEGESYLATVDLFSMLSLVCCTVMLVRPLLQSLVRKHESQMQHAKAKVVRERL